MNRKLVERVCGKCGYAGRCGDGYCVALEVLDKMSYKGLIRC